MTVNDNDGHGPAPPLPFDHVLFTDLDGLEGVLVDLNTKKYFQLNETASLVWRGIEKGLSIGAIAKQMTEAYDVTLEQAVVSVESAVRSFAAQKLLRPGHS